MLDQLLNGLNKSLEFNRHHEDNRVLGGAPLFWWYVHTYPDTEGRLLVQVFISKNVAVGCSSKRQWLGLHRQGLVDCSGSETHP